MVDRGEAMLLSAEAFGPTGRPLEDVELVWTMVDPRAGTLSDDGRFRASDNVGVFKDAVSVTGIQNTVLGIKYATAASTVTVVGETSVPELNRVAILPDEPTVLAGQIYRLRAVGYDASGFVIPGVSFVWRMNNPVLGRVNDIGYMTVEAREGMFPEAITVTGVWEGTRVSHTTGIRVVDTPQADDFMRVHVLPQRFHISVGDRLQLRAVALNGLGELVRGTQIRWTMADPQAGSVSGSGLFVAGDVPGIYTEVVKVEAIVPGERGFARAADFASIVIKAKRLRRLEALRVFPDSLVVGLGGRALLGAQPVDASGLPAASVGISWAMRTEGVGVIDDHGSFKATGDSGIYPDAIAVTAEQPLDGEGVTKTRTLDVTITGRLTQLQVYPTLATIAPGRTVHFRVAGLDEKGHPLSGLVVIWKVSDEGIGTMDHFGNFTAGEVPGVYESAIRAKVIQTLPRPK